MSLLDRSKKGKGHGHLSERRLAKTFDMCPTPASGAMLGCKSDAYSREFRMECKSTVTSVLSLEHGWLCKIKHEALASNKEPVLSVSFVTGNGQAKADGDWFLVRKELFEEFKEYMQRKQDEISKI